MDLTALTDDELALHAQAVHVELDRRRLERDLPARIDSLIGEYQAAQGLGQGEEWVQPTGAHDAYRQGVGVADPRECVGAGCERLARGRGRGCRTCRMGATHGRARFLQEG